MKQMLQEIKALDSINSIDNLINDLLYNEQSGYLMLDSKVAISRKYEIIQKFDFEIEKILQSVNIENLDFIIKARKKYFLEKIENHYLSQVLIWKKEVFESAVDNLALRSKLDKIDFNEIKFVLSNLVNWFVENSGLCDEDINSIFSKCLKEIEEKLSQNDLESALSLSEITTDFQIFYDLFKKSQNIDDFLKIDFAQYADKLSSEDKIFFEKIFAELKTNKKYSLLNDIDLIIFAIEFGKLKKPKEKYKFIKSIFEDFKTIKSDNILDICAQKNKLVKFRLELITQKNKYFEKSLKGCTIYSNE